MLKKYEFDVAEFGQGAKHAYQTVCEALFSEEFSKYVNGYVISHFITTIYELTNNSYYFINKYNYVVKLVHHQMQIFLRMYVLKPYIRNL